MQNFSWAYRWLHAGLKQPEQLLENRLQQDVYERRLRDQQCPVQQMILAQDDSRTHTSTLAVRRHSALHRAHTTLTTQQ